MSTYDSRQPAGLQRQQFTLRQRSSQQQQETTPTSTASIPTLRHRFADGSTSRPAQRYRLSLQEAPAIPAIPARFLGENARPASVLAQASPHSPGTYSTHSAQSSPRPQRHLRQTTTDIEPAPALYNERPPRTSGIDLTTRKRAQSVSRTSRNGVSRGRTSLPDLSSTRTRGRSLPATAHPPTLARLEDRSDQTFAATMARRAKNDGDDLFLELAQNGDQSDGEERVRRPQFVSERTASRMSQTGKRRSMPPAEIETPSIERRPKSSGTIFNRPSSRLGADLHRHVNRHRSPSAAAVDDTRSVSGRSLSGRAYHFSSFPERSSLSPSSRLADRIKSEELPSYGRRRPSFGGSPLQASQNRQGQGSSKMQGSQDESPADSSEPKRSLPDSGSVDSSTADTVWDELDDLKSRIKKLELTGKLPATSGAAISGESGERPRTATTAPTTIDSSPKHERKPEAESTPPPSANANGVGGPNVQNIHPLLHAALAKAKPLLNATLYRTLEATSSDALQLAALTGSAGPQGTAFSAASIINGVTVADRHVRRKADTMCRNLTDLCLALCEGKHEAPSVTASPIALSSATGSPTIRYSRSSIGPSDSLRRVSSRPMSRLEARRTSILGFQASDNPASSPRDNNEDISASEQEGTPSHQPDPSRDPRRMNRASSRLLSVRTRYDDPTSGDDDPTVRPLSRAMTDIGSRAKQRGSREYTLPGSQQQQQRSPSLRDTLAARRTSGAAYEKPPRETSRAPSLSVENARRSFTSPVLEEEGQNGGAAEYEPSISSQQSKRRITSMGQFGARRTGLGDGPSRTSSLTQRRHVVVE